MMRLFLQQMKIRKLSARGSHSPKVPRVELLKSPVSANSPTKLLGALTSKQNFK